MAIKQLFNANNQQMEDAEFTVDANNEIVATFEDGSFIKFPDGLTKKQFETLIEKHRTDNEGQEVISPESEKELEAARKRNLDLIGEEPESDKTNASTDNAS